MLEIITLEDEVFLPKENKFITVPSTVITLEHSLISIAKWESKWHIPYLSDKPRTHAQEIDYFRCMAINNVKNDKVFELLSTENVSLIIDYINNPMTATVFSKRGAAKGRKEIITAETIYYRMFMHNIPIECQKWHLNRLLTLIRVFDLNSSPKSKMSKQQTAQWNAQQNAARRARLNSRG